MALIDEATRRKVHASLVAVHGEEVGDGIMAHLPPVGWADVATKHDLAHAVEVLEIRFDGLESRMDSRIDGLGSRIDGLESSFTARLESDIAASEARMQSALHREISKQTRLYIFTTLGAILTVASMGFAGLGG